MLKSDQQSLGPFQLAGAKGASVDGGVQPAEDRLQGALSGVANPYVDFARHQAGHAAALHRRQLEVALAAADMGTWFYRFAGDHWSLDERAQELYGLETATALHDRETVRRILHPDDIEPMWDAVRAACDPAGPGRYGIDYRVRCREGGYRWVRAWGQVEFDGDGPARTPVMMIGCSRDVTIEIQAQRDLETELNAAKGLQELSTHLIQSNNTEELHEHFLDAALTLLGADGASLQVLDAKGETLRLLGHRGFTDDAARFWRVVDVTGESTCGRALRAGRRVLIRDVLECESLAGSPDLPVYLQTSIRAVQSTPLLSRTGTLLGMVSTHWRSPHEPSAAELRGFDVLARQAADLIDRKRAEQALRESENRLRLLADSTPALVSSLDRNLVYRFVNRAYSEWFDQPKEAMEGRHIREVVGEDTFAVIEPKLRAALAGETTSYEATLPYARGGSRYVLATYTPDVAPSGDVQGVFVMVYDISARRQTEEALAASEREFRGMFELAGAGQAQADDVTGRFTRVNRKLCEITGYDEGELLQMTPADLTHPDDRASDAERIGAAIRGQRPDWRSEKRYIRKDGQVVWVLVTGAPIRDEAGRVVRTAAIIQDITKHKQAEADLLEARDNAQHRAREAEEGSRLLAAMMEHIPLGITIADAPDVTIRAVSRYGRELIGRAPEHIENIPAELHAKRWRILRSDGVTPASNEELPLTRATQHGEVVREEEFVVERLDGERIPILCTAAPIRDAEGKIAGGVIGWQDIRERKRVEQALRESEERYRTLFESMDEAYAVVEVMRDQAGRWSDFLFLEVNPAFVKHTGMPYPVGQTATQLLGTPNPRWADIYGQVAETGEPVRIEEREPTLDRIFDLYIFRLGGPGSRRVAVLFTDVTGRKRAEQQRDALLESERAARTTMEHLSRAKDEFISVINHELRSPLAVVLGWSRMLQKGRLSGDSANEAINSVVRGAEQLKQLIDDLLDVSRVVSGKLKLDVAPFDLAGLVRQTVGDFATQAEEAELQLESDIPERVEPVIGDSARLRQVIANLLSNATKFTPAGGKIRLRLIRNRTRLVISVEDTGIGIGPGVLPTLFERFRQADSSITRKYKGLGLGLALVKQIVELHGGCVRAASDGEGCGSTFIVELPRPDEGNQPDESDGEFSADLAGLGVLLVDDDPATLNLTARVLEESGANVTRCLSAGEALEALRGQDFDVLVSDISMPEVDGFTLLRAVRELPDPRKNCLPAMALTAFGRVKDEQRCLNAGFDMHHGKPLVPAEFCAAVRDLAVRSIRG